MQGNTHPGVCDLELFDGEIYVQKYVAIISESHPPIIVGHKDEHDVSFLFS